jgi:hypothetical protein
MLDHRKQTKSRSEPQNPRSQERRAGSRSGGFLLDEALVLALSRGQKTLAAQSCPQGQG